MRKELTVGILKETKSNETRSPLTPKDVAWLKRRFISVEVESDKKRVFSDAEYKRAGAAIVRKCRNASLLIGVKEPKVSSLQPNKIYMFFSHTIKGQPENRSLLKACLNRNITLIDYEKISDKDDRRLVYFGKFAGVCGVINSLYFLGKKYEAQKIKNPFAGLKTARNYKSYEKAKESVREIGERIHRKGIDKRIAPFIIGLTGLGNVGAGALEILKLLKPKEIHPKDLADFVRNSRLKDNRVYQIIFDREEKFRAKGERSFYFEEYLKHPDRFESNMDVYLPFVNLIVHTSYWDKRFPRLITKKMVDTMGQAGFRLEFIGDIACDVKGSIQITCRTTTEDSPVYTYNPKSRKYSNGYKAKGVTILARDNLPAELPRDSSEDFSSLIKEYVYQIAAHGITDVTKHVALPKEIRNAVIVQRKSLTKPFTYLKKYL